MFNHYEDKAWTLPKEKLVGYFRSADDSSDNVGQLQATCFQTLSEISGHVPAATGVAKPAASKKSNGTKKSNLSKKSLAKTPIENNPTVAPQFGIDKTIGLNGANLTVRIGLNLPVSDDQSVYDRIFRSIRENLMNG